MSACVCLWLMSIQKYFSSLANSSAIREEIFAFRQKKKKKKKYNNNNKKYNKLRQTK